MAAKYTVTSDPGTPVPGIGFVKPGETYTAPHGHIPSRTALPANAEAAAELKKVQASLLADAAKLRADAKNADLGLTDEEKRSKLALASIREKHAKEIRTEIFTVPVAEPAIEQTLTLEQLEGVRGGINPPGEKQQTRKL